MTPDKNTTEDIAGTKPPSPPASATEDETFRVDELSGFSQAIGHPAHVIDGAYSGTAGSHKTTIAEAKKRVTAWLKGEVVTDPAHDEE